MATGRELPADFAAALDRYPAAAERFDALPAARQDEWLAWIDSGRGRRGRAARIDEAIRRLSPPATATEEQVTEPVGPPPERGWWIWLLLLLLLVIAGLLLWYFLSRGSGKTTVPPVVGLRSQQAAGVAVAEGTTVILSVSTGVKPVTVPSVVGETQGVAVTALTRAGLKPKLQNVPSAQPPGQVVSQKPPAGRKVDKGSTVTLN